MAAAPQPVNEAAAQVARSIQSMTAAHAMNEELNNNAQAPVVRHALSQVESTQKDQELQRGHGSRHGQHSAEQRGALAQVPHEVSNGRSPSTMG